LERDSTRWLWRKKIFYDDILISRGKREKRTIVLDHYLVGAEGYAGKKKSRD